MSDDTTAAATSRAASSAAALGAVCLEGIVKRHGETTVLHGIDLAIELGEFFVLLGPSGSGKTTTLRILAGLESVSAGRVLMDGADVTTAPPGERDVAMVFQSYALYPHMTVEGNIGFPLKMVGRPRDEIVRAVARAAAKVGIEHLLQRTPGQLSGGQQQRVALARAIVRQPRLFLLDEPLSNLDAKLRLETRIEVHRLQRSLGVTTVYVTHDQEEAMTLADRIAVFMDGRIVQTGTPREIFDRPKTTRGRRFHRHAADEPAGGGVERPYGRDRRGRYASRRAGRDTTPGDARRAPRRPAHRCSRHRGNGRARRGSRR